jgi:assimilatory nitrate reductase electron transfer subunit
VRRVLVVGNGMAGSRFVQELLERDADRRCSVTVVGEEHGAAYNRIQLSNVLAGVAKAADIAIATPQWFAANQVDLLDGCAVSSIDRAARQVVLADGRALGYEVLVLATGSDAIAPPVPGLRAADGSLRPGAALFRTLSDCDDIDARAAAANAAVVVGGGLLGLEAARGLAGRGLTVTVVQRGPKLMEQQLDSGASEVLVRAMRQAGVQVVADAVLSAVLGAEAVSGVALADGSTIDADLLVLCCGVRPRVDLARAAGLEVNAGVVVDDCLRTNDPDIFAIGECAEHRGRTYGLVAPAWEQARVAADVIAGRGTTYPGSVVVTRLKAAGIELAAMGESSLDGADDVRFVDGGRGVYQKLVVRDGRLAGAILLGDTRTAGTVISLFDRGGAVPVDRAGLLMARSAATAATASPTTLPGRATVCQCNGVTKTAICDAWQGGSRTVAEVAHCTRATTGCGSCRDTVEGLLDWLAAADPEPAAAPATPLPDAISA